MLKGWRIGFCAAFWKDFMMDYKTEFLKCLGSINQGKRDYEIFQDFLSVSAIAYANVGIKDENLEKQYFKIIEQYKIPEKLAELLYITTLALEAKTHDFLGEVYTQGNFGCKSSGQFFTPYYISQLMAEITLDIEECRAKIKKENFISFSEPCCGAGGMIIACCETLLKHGINPQQEMWFQAIDIDKNCVNMTYIQTSLLGLAGEVIHGDTLCNEYWQKYITPIVLFPVLQKR